MDDEGERDDASDHRSPVTPMSGVIREIAGDDDGLPRVHRVVVDMDDGSVFKSENRPADGALKETAAFLAAIPARHFDRCPICLLPGDLTREHVPQGQLGGHVMTSTCRTCNNRLGSRIEADMTDFYNGAIGRASFTAEGVRGRRKAGRAPIRFTPQGEPVLVPDRIDSEILDILRAGGEITIHGVQDLNAYRIAALKHAYLAACLWLGVIPQTPSAERIRTDLLAARNAARTDQLPDSNEAAKLRTG
jgi:hypothetical protein